MALRATKGNEGTLEPAQWIKGFDCVFNGVPMARCGPPRAMKTRLSRHNGIKVFDASSTERTQRDGSPYHNHWHTSQTAQVLPRLID